MLMLTENPVMRKPTKAEKPAKTFCEKMRTLREDAGVTQRALAEYVGVVQSQIGRWENGVGGPRPDQLFKISRALKVDLEYLCDDQAEEIRPNYADANAIVELLKSLGFSLDDLGRIRAILTQVEFLGLDVSMGRLMLVKDAENAPSIRSSPSIAQTGPSQSLTPKGSLKGIKSSKSK